MAVDVKAEFRVVDRVLRDVDMALRYLNMNAAEAGRSMKELAELSRARREALYGFIGGPFGDLADRELRAAFAHRAHRRAGDGRLVIQEEIASGQWRTVEIR